MAPDAGTSSPIAAAGPVGEFHGLQVTAKRVYRDEHSPASFGGAWTDQMRRRRLWKPLRYPLGRPVRDLTDVVKLGSSSGCPNRTPIHGTLNDPHTGFSRGSTTRSAVKVDHIFLLAAAFDVGAWAWTDEQRIILAEDPANLLAVSGPANQSKSDSLPVTTPDRQGHSWMPPNRAYRCAYAQKLLAVAGTYALPIVQASVPVLTDALFTCPAP